VKWLGKGMFIATGVYQGVLEMVLLVPFWEIFNQQIGHLGIKIRG
jgi:hypothetical protein